MVLAGGITMFTGGGGNWFGSNFGLLGAGPDPGRLLFLSFHYTLLGRACLAGTRSMCCLFANLVQ
jgi:hypothetical protein